MLRVASYVPYSHAPHPFGSLMHGCSAHIRDAHGSEHLPPGTLDQVWVSPAKRMSYGHMIRHRDLRGTVFPIRERGS